jgi:hypothetical protein
MGGGYSGEVKAGKGRCSFLKKRIKKLLLMWNLAALRNE